MEFEEDQDDVDVPFIGDGYCEDEGDFYQLEEKEITLFSANFKDAGLKAEVRLQTMCLASMPERFDYVIVGVASMVPRSEKLKTITRKWSRLNPDSEGHLISYDEIDVNIQLQLTEKTNRRKKTMEMEGYTFALLPRNDVPSFQNPLAAIIAFTDPIIHFHDNELHFYLNKARNNAKACQKIMFDTKILNSDEYMGLIEDCIGAVNQCRDTINVIKNKHDFTTFESSLKTYGETFKEIVSFIESLQNTMKVIEDLKEKCQAKIDYTMEIEREGMNYLCAQDYSDLAFAKSSKIILGDNLFLFKSTSFPDDEWAEALKLFRTLMNTSLAIKNRWKFNVVDLDTVVPDDLEDIPDGPVIRHLQNGVFICKDFWEHLNSRGVSYIEFDPEVVNEDKSSLTNEISLFQIVCPTCPELTRTMLPWTCSKCKTIIEYHGKGILACNCGFVCKESLSFKCKNYYHTEFTLSTIMTQKATITKLDSVKLLKKVNILLIGQSGVGKSTWINALANYLLFSSLDEALNNEPVTLIPGQFSITDDDGVLHSVVIGDDNNEELTVGASATQACRSYVLYLKGQRITLIDTPGLGDTRGYDQDIRNVRNIIEHLKTIPEIHAVCFLLLPNESRTNASLLYPLKEIMCYLHCSVLPNLTFVFTNARSTNYRVGETFPILQTVMSEARQRITLNDNTVYKFDNESYRFLCAYLKSSLTFTDRDKNTFKGSWEQSSKEAMRFLRTVTKRNPYKSQLTIDLGYVRMKMHKVISEVVTLNTWQSPDAINDEIERCREKIETLKKCNFVNVKLLKQSESVPQLVCTGCATVAGGGSVYKSCMTQCFDSNNFNTLSNVELRNAAVFQNPRFQNLNCTQCTCRWEVHMVVDFTQELVDEQQENEKVTADIKEAEKLIEELEERLQNLEDNEANDENRKKTLIDFAKILANYLAQHSFFLSNDAIPGYIDFLIQSLDMTPNKTELQYAQLKDLQNSKRRVEESLSVVDQFKNTSYVMSSYINYMSLRSIDESEQKCNINLPDDTEVVELTAEKRLFIE